MRNAVSFMFVCLASVSLAQGVLSLLIGEVDVTARAVNERGSVFIELDRTPPNIMLAVREGVVMEDSQRLALITPEGQVHYAVIIGEMLLSYSMPWVEFVKQNSPMFNMDNLVIEGVGQYLTPSAIADARATPTPLGQGQGPSQSRPMLTYDGCTYTSSPNRYESTCYQGGRRTYGVLCTADPVTHNVICRAR